MIIIKESSDYLEMKKISIYNKILEMKDKICSYQKQLDETTNEKHIIDLQMDKTKEKINSARTLGYYLLMIFVFSIFMFSIGNLIAVALSFFVALILVYRSKNYFDYQNTFDEQHHICVEKEKKIEDFGKIIAKYNDELKSLNKKYNDYIKGLIGEEKVTETLKKLEYDSYLINDITLDKGFGNIDHILVSRYGIFIIETKNWDGEIICNEDKWNKRYENEYSPVDLDIDSISKRVKGNARKLRLLIGAEIFHNLRTVWVEGIIVFTNINSKIKTINPTVPVLTIEELIEYIKRQQPRTKFSPKELESIAHFVSAFNN